jgi:hypothetical protein
MFLRATKRKKDGKEHRYWSVVESVRSGRNHSFQRTVLYLGELNDSEQAAWTKALEVFNVDSGRLETRSLFPQDRKPPPGVAEAISIRVCDYELKRPRQFGACWLAMDLWKQLLESFWTERLAPSREGTDWARLLQVLVTYRLIEPGSEWRCHRLWYERTAMGDLLGEDFSLGGKDQLYATLDHLLPHKEALFGYLRQRWEDLFGIKYEILLYDLTSTYFEGACQELPQAEYGYSRDHRPDCRQVVIALVITPEGFPLAYEVLAGNTADKTTLRQFVDKIEKLHGKAERIWIMDRGVPTEEVLAQLREMNPKVHYLVGTPKSWVKQKLDQWEKLSWQKVRESVEVKLFEENNELFVVAKSDPRQQKEIAIRRKKLARLLRTLRAMRREKSRDRLLQRLGAARSKAGRCARLVEFHLPKVDESITRSSFTFSLNKEGLKTAELYDGHYLLRTNMRDKEPEFLWQLYMRLSEIESAFKTFKNDLHLRPIYHWTETRVEAHILVCFLAYCLQVTLRQKLRGLAPGLTARAVLELLAGIQMLDVEMPTTDNRWLILPRYTEPDKASQLILSQLKMTLPAQPPPRLSSERKLDPPF